MALFRNRWLLVLPLLIAVLTLTGVMRHARNGLSDLLFSFRAVPSSVAIIAIDEQSIQSIGQWPWPRAVFGQALARLTPAAAVGIDVNFKEASRWGTADDQVLAAALRTAPMPVILASEMQADGTVIHPIPLFTDASTTGLANITIDADGTVRTVRLKRGSALAFGAQLVYAVRPTSVPEESVRIRYLGPPGTVPTYSFLDLIRGRVPDSALAGRIVLIGATARDLQDYQHTPLGLMSGVEIQATITDNVSAHDFIRTDPWLDFGLTFIAGLFGVFIGLRFRKIWVLLTLIMLLVIGIWATVFLLFNGGLLLDLLMPTGALLTGSVAAVLVRYVATARERRFIHDAFSRYLAPEVIAELLRDPTRVRLGGQRRELTILFSDIRGFTTLSETMSPPQLAQFLNRYLGAMTDLILAQKGVVDKYIGDAIMAFWGAPLDDANQADHAVAAALGMVQALKQFNAESAARGLQAIDIGIGLNSGTATVGNMGSEKRFDYTAIGDAVNLASRLEGLTKTYGVNILISDRTMERLSPHMREGIAVRELDRVRVKGKNYPVTLFEVSREPLAAVGLFDRARRAYTEGRWEEAITAFDEFLVAVPGDSPAQTLKERCQGFRHRPMETWDGIFDLQHK